MKPIVTPNSSPSNYHDLNSLNQLRQQAQSDEKLALKKAVKEFEAYFLNLMLKNMRAANKVIGEDSPLTSNDVSFYNEMHDQQLSVNLSQSTSFGIGDMLYKQLARGLPADRTVEPATNIKVANSKFVNLPVQPTQLDQPAEQGASLDKIDNRESSKSALVDVEEAKVDATKYQDIKVKDPSPIDKTNSKAQEIQFNSKQDFIDYLKPYAKKAASALGVHPGVLVAQAALETGWGKFFGKTNTGEPSLNLFGIKADSRWSGKAINAPTIEFNQGIPEKVNQKFRAYQSVKDSFDDYIDFIKTNPRYQKALENHHDPKAYLNSIQEGGYATDPDYADKIHSIFIRESLYRISDE